MQSHIFLSKCLAVGWVSLVWSLSQSSAKAAIPQASDAILKPPTEKVASPENVLPVFAAASSRPVARSPDGEPLTDAEHPTAGSFAAAPSSPKVAAPLTRPKAGPSAVDALANLDPTVSVSNKPAKTAAPQLEIFLAIALNADEQSDEAPDEQQADAVAPADSSASPDDPQSPDESDSTAEPVGPRDPELGIIEVSDSRQDPELGIIQLRNPLQDSELGILELRQIAPPPPPRPFLFASAYATAASSDNVFSVEDPVVGRFGDNYIRPGISLTAFPALGPETNLLASVETNFLRYQDQSNSSYDELRFRAGVRHRFTDNTYGQLTFSSQLLYDEGFQDQFFTNNGIEVTLGRRDLLTPQLTLDSFYQSQIYFSDPEEFSNVLNSVGAYLGYRFSSQWDTGLGYRLTISDFTQQSRHETYQRITGQLRYSITPSVRVSIFGGLSYGRSSESRVNFDDSFFGISFDATVQVF